jgi:hypothetical protein
VHVQKTRAMRKMLTECHPFGCGRILPSGYLPHDAQSWHRPSRLKIGKPRQDLRRPCDSVISQSGLR